MKQSPEYSPRRRDLLKRVFSLGVAVAAQPLLGTLGIFDGQVAHAQEASSPENGSAQLIQAIEATAKNVSLPVYEKTYTGKKTEIEDRANGMFQKGIAATLVAGFSEDASFMITMSRRDNNLYLREPGHFSLVYLRGLDRENIDPSSNFTPAREAPFAVFESTIADPVRPGQVRQEFFIIINPDFAIMTPNDIRLPFTVSRIAEYIRASHTKESELMSQGITDPQILHQIMLSSKTQSDIAQKSKAHAAKATSELLTSETGSDWFVPDTFKTELEQIASSSENLAFGDVPISKQPLAENP